MENQLFMQNHCLQTGKVYIIITVCLLFTSLLTTINIIQQKRSKPDNNLFGTGIAINIIQTFYTLYLVYIDLFGKCSEKTEKCGNNCKWYTISPSNPKKCTPIGILRGFVYIPIILLSSSYLLGFGILNLLNSENSENSENEITTLSIASVIFGAMGILFIFSDLVCSIKCYC